MSTSEHEQRCRLAAASLAGHKLDALAVFSPANVRYLTGFTGSSSMALLLADRTILFTDPRYRLQAHDEVGCQVRVAKDPLPLAAANWLRKARVRRVGIEKAHVSHEGFLTLDDHLPPAVRLIPVADLVESLRIVKSPGEIEAIRRSVRTSSEAFLQAVSVIRPGISEVEVAAEIEFRMRRLGAERPAFETIIAFGRRSALVHASPTSERLALGELVLMDVGAIQGGYSSDMTRMAFAGHPGPKLRRLYCAVLEAQLAAIAAVREGVTAASVDRAARQVLRSYGLDRAFVHSTGHGLGLEVHEIPRLGRGNRARLQAGMAITIEPGVYLHEFGGIRIEDTLVVTRNGCEVLTPTSKELHLI